MRIFRKSYKKYAGPVIYGAKGVWRWSPRGIAEAPHFERCLWLTSMVESAGRVGAVMMADGTGATVGLHQAVAVYPRNLRSQGPAFVLTYDVLQAIRETHPEATFKLEEMLSRRGWELTDKGLRCDGELVAPSTIRNTFTPSDGVVPPSGTKWEQACAWARAWHELFADRRGLEAQIDHALDGMMAFAKHNRSRRFHGSTLMTLIYDHYGMVGLYDHLPELDLAMAMWWNYKTNLPAPAMTRLGRAIQASPNDPQRFGRALIRSLGTAKIGAWSGRRYRASRRHAMKVWPERLFVGEEVIMPKSFAC